MGWQVRATVRSASLTSIVSNSETPQLPHSAVTFQILAAVLPLTPVFLLCSWFSAFSTITDSDQIGSLTDRLQAARWVQDTRRKERWLTKIGARIDLLPIGDRARSRGYVTWRKAGMRMSVVGLAAKGISKETL